MAEQLKRKEVSVIHGCKLCRNYLEKTKDLADDEVVINECDDGDVGELERSLQIVEYQCFRISLKTHAVVKTTKIKAVCNKLERSFDKQKEMVKDIFKLPDTSQLDAKEIVIEMDMQRKADDFDRLILLMKEKLNDNSLKTSQ